MKKMDLQTLEKYQILLQKDPDSKIFAPLAEAYRQMNMLKEAEQTAREGIAKHPKFSGGLVTLSKILIETQRDQEALPFLQKATEVDPENILAHQLMASQQLKNRNPKEALKSYKMVLFLNPQSEKTKIAIEKLESLTADEFDESLFELENTVEENSIARAPSFSISPDTVANAQSIALSSQPPGLEKYISMIDAYIIRNNLEKAESLLWEARHHYGSHALLQSRENILKFQSEEEPAPLSPIISREKSSQEAKLKVLHQILKNIDTYRQNSFDLSSNSMG